jgi:hypothetical protein
MPAAAINAHQVVRECPVARPAIEQAPPTINSVPGALEDLVVMAERLQALFDSNIADFTSDIVEAEALPARMRDRTTSIWLIFLVASEKLAELSKIIEAVNEKAHAERRAVAA